MKMPNNLQKILFHLTQFEKIKFYPHELPQLSHVQAGFARAWMLVALARQEPANQDDGKHRTEHQKLQSCCPSATSALEVKEPHSERLKL